MKRFQQHAEGHSNHERWLLTYADMITLLTAFFLMLYSMSVMSKGKFSPIALSIRDAFGGNLPKIGAYPTSRTGILPDNQYRKYTQAIQKLSRYVEEHKLEKQVTTRNDSRGMIISLVADNMLFDRGKAQLSASSNDVLAKVSDILKASPNNITIEGHTCDLPIHTAQFPSNWELSSARASVILRYFTEQRRLDLKRFNVAGYADTKPLFDNTSEANRIRNRRVDIVLLKTEEQQKADLVRSTEIQRILASSSNKPQESAVSRSEEPTVSDPLDSSPPESGGGSPVDSAGDRSRSETTVNDTNHAAHGENIGGTTPGP